VATAGTLSGARQATARLLPRAAAAVLDAETNAARSYLAGVAAGLEAHGDAAEMVVSRGEPVGGLLDVARDRDVDIAVVATSRRAGRAMLWNESFAARLIERGALPVLLVRRAEDDEG
jgi:nucleotide-binding universal stress UspA family protein